MNAILHCRHYWGSESSDRTRPFLSLAYILIAIISWLSGEIGVVFLAPRFQWNMTHFEVDSIGFLAESTGCSFET